MINISQVLNWKFNGVSGIATRGNEITKFPGGIPTQAEQDSWRAEYATHLEEQNIQSLIELAEVEYERRAGLIIPEKKQKRAMAKAIRILLEKVEGTATQADLNLIAGLKVSQKAIQTLEAKMDALVASVPTMTEAERMTLDVTDDIHWQ